MTARQRLIDSGKLEVCFMVASADRCLIKVASVDNQLRQVASTVLGCVTVTWSFELGCSFHRDMVEISSCVWSILV
jgi:hypothetical protein